MRERPLWLNKPIVVAGNWEPLIHRRRCGGGSDDAAAAYAREHTPALADRLREAGVTLLITHWFKGFGLQAEADDMDAARRLIALCHERGIRVGGYVGDTFIYETMLLEEPEAEQWCQRKVDGTPVTFGATQTWRWKWCRNNPAFMAYMRRVLRLGLEAGLDMVHFDNFLNKPEPKTCRCVHCTAQFRDFLERKYPIGRRRERLGYGDVSAVRPPWSTTALYVNLGADVIHDPLWQEWIDFRCESLARSYVELGAFCRSLKPDVVIESNPTGIWGENAAHMRSVDHARLLPHGDFFWDESPNGYGLFENQALATNLRSMKLGEATGNRTFFYCWHGPDARTAALRMGEALAANDGCLGMISFLDGDSVPGAALCRPFVEFLHAHHGLLAGTRSLARVGVYRNFASLAYNAWEPHLQCLLAEQALLQGNVPFDLVFDLEKAAHDVIVVPGMECLSDAEIEALGRVAAVGRRVMLVGHSGAYDAWRRQRGQWPLKDTPGIDGLPALEPGAGAPAKGERRIWDDYYAVVDSRFWAKPLNADALLSRVPSPIRVQAPPAILALPRLAADGRTLLIHVLDYDPAREAPATVCLSFPDITFQGPARLLVPGRPPHDIHWTGALTVKHPYTMVALPTGAGFGSAGHGA